MLDPKTMIETQLKPNGITDRRLLEVMERIPRERFVVDQAHHLAYTDQALSIDCEQTISQPFMVAFMTQALRLNGTEKVLEIGTGSGYQTAILAELAKQVVTIERHELLSQQACVRLRVLGYNNVEFLVGDGTLGDPTHAPYDRILVTAGSPTVPQALCDQLADQGRLVIPIGDEESQQLVVVTKIDNQLHSEKLLGCRFVKLIGEQGWKIA